jgi:hypothetical protein
VGERAWPPWLKEITPARQKIPYNRELPGDAARHGSDRPGGVWKRVVLLTGDRGFESISLQRRVSEPSVPSPKARACGGIGLAVRSPWILILALGPHLVFVAYAGAGVGALDVSNSDAVAGQDPTNPV